ncbi:MAG: hypothetical protein ACXVCP_17075 [Bdellovibrio sp.]
MNYSKIAKQELPFEGEFFLSKNKKFKEIVFFVHFYEGSKKHILRHIRMVNKLGFDAFAFNLKGHHSDISALKFPISSKKMFGTKHLYADQIEKLLNLVPGKKIIFSFSNPTAAAIEAMARRKCSDTVALICDSGPSGSFLPSVYKLMTHQYGMKSLPLKMALTPLAGIGWSPFLHRDLHKDLNTFPEGFKILSIRGWKDSLISVHEIDEVFEPHKQLDWIKLSLPRAEHLTGLRDFAESYVPVVENFLAKVATPITSI